MSGVEQLFQSPEILIIDDNIANVKVIMEYLAGHGFQIMMARTGEKGLELARLEQPGLILLDLVLPGIDGFEVCRRLKADEQTRQIPVIFMTILTRLEDKVRGFRVGGVDYITKPFQAEEALSRIQTHLQLRELTEHLEHKVAEQTEELRAANAQLQHELAERKKAEQERMAHLHFLESISNTSRAIHDSDDLEKMMVDVLDVMLSTFDCDRVWLTYPCDPDAASWSVPMERTKPEYPGANVIGLEIPMDEEVARGFRMQLSSDGPVIHGPGTDHLLLEDVNQQFRVQSAIMMVLHPKVGKPWLFGMHQCSHARRWTAWEEKLFQEIGRRLEDALTSLLSYRKLQESEERYRLVFENSPVSIWEEDFSGVKALLDSLRKGGVDDIENYLVRHPETVRRCAEMVKILDVNNAALTLHSAADKDELLAGLVNTFTPESFNTFREELVCIWDGATGMKSDAVVKTLDGEFRNVTVCWSVCPGYEENLSRVIVSLIDITEQKSIEQERMDHLHFLESMGRINQAIQGTSDLEQMMSDVLDVMLSIFDCDRAFLMYPCDPESDTWTCPMERNKPEYPGVLELNLELPIDEDVAETLRILLAADGPVQFGPGTSRPLPEDVSEQFGFKSFMSLAIYPKIGGPWQFGMHQCACARQWTTREERLFQAIGNRLADGLTSLISFRNLQESEERYHLAFENSPVSIWEEDFSGIKSFLDNLKKQGVTNIETYLDQHPEAVRRCTDLVKITDVNQASLTLYGAADKEELLADLGNTLTPESFDYFRKELVCLWNGGTEMKSDSVVKTLSGALRIVTISFSVCPGYEETLSRVIVSIHDITERKQAEETLHLDAERIEALLHLNQMTGMTLEEITTYAFDAAVRLTRSKLGYLAFMNEEETVMTMQLWSNKAMAECKVPEKPIIYTVETAGLWGEAVRQRRPIITNDYNAPNPWKKGTPEGHVRLTRHMNLPVIVDGRIVLVAGVGNKEEDYNDTDVNQLTLLMEGMWRLVERKRAQEALLRINEELEQRVCDRTAQLETANKELEAFAYSVSHDLMAPLRHIDGFLELLQKKTETLLDKQSRHYMDLISDSAEKMGALIDDLLSFSRMGRQEMLLKPVNLGALVPDIIRELEPETAGRNIDWRVGGLPAVKGDAAMLRIVLVNLISNALKFTHTREKARIEIGSVPGQTSETVIFVRDNGGGFDMAYADKLFGVFQRLHRADEFEGTGIGLANVRRIIARHGGRTWAEGKVDQGATFYFSLPQVNVNLPINKKYV